MEPGAEAVERFAAAWSALEEELDWGLLGRLHCAEGGDDFFGVEDRAALLETGLLFADDLGRDNVGAYGLGSDLPATPRIDLLAETGVLFRNAWAAPTCSPAQRTPGSTQTTSRKQPNRRACLS